MANIVQVTCPKCEGTGERIDDFNPPLHGYFDKSLDLYMLGIRTTTSGRRILGGVCTECDGRRWVWALRYHSLLYSKLDGPELVKRLKASPEIKWTVDGTDVLMANGQSAGIPKVFRELASDFLGEISQLTGMCCLHIMVNRQPAGNVIPRHTDTVKGRPFRYHLPLITNLDVAFWNEKDHWYWMGQGVWHPFDYSIPHAVVNFGGIERVHLIVDLIPF